MPQATMHSFAMVQHNMAFIKVKNLFYMCIHLLSHNRNKSVPWINCCCYRSLNTMCAHMHIQNRSPQSDIHQLSNLFQHAPFWPQIYHLVNTFCTAQNHEHKCWNQRHFWGGLQDPGQVLISLGLFVYFYRGTCWSFLLYLNTEEETG